MPFFLQGLETEYEARLVTQIALVVIALCESVAETCERQIQFHRSKRDRVRDWDIDATADDEIKGVVAGRPHDNAPRTILFQIGVHVRVCAAEHSLNKGLHVRRTEFNYRPNVVGKEIALRGAGTDTSRAPFSDPCGVRVTESGIREVEVPRLASVTFELGFDPNYTVKDPPPPFSEKLLITLLFSGLNRMCE